MRDFVEEATPATMANVEAEQAVLGALLVKNDALHRLHGLRAAHFFDPVHGDIFEKIAERVHDGRTASPVSMKADFPSDRFDGLGGAVYLLRLADMAATVFDASTYAREIIDAWGRRRIIEAAQEAISLAESGAAPFEVASTLDASVIGLDFSNTRGRLRFSESALATAEMVAAAYQNDGKSTGIYTGLRDVDKFTGGFKRGNLVVIAGRPGMGKSAFLSSVVLSIARQDHPFKDPGPDDRPLKCGVIIISLEMSDEEIVMRINSDAMRRSGESLPYNFAGKGFIDTAARDAVREEQDMKRWVQSLRAIEALPISIADVPSQSNLQTILSEIRRRAAMLEDMGAPVGVIAIDHLGLIAKPNSRDNEASRVGYITSAFKGLAKRMDCCVLLLSQLNRGVENREDKRPHLSDLRDSGAVEQDADVVIFPYRPEYYLRRAEPSENDAAARLDWEGEIQRWEGLAEIRIAKNRSGPEGLATVCCDIGCNHFADLARQEAF